MEEKLKTVKKRQTLDYVVAGIALIGLIVCAFFWSCELDMIITILVTILGVALTVFLVMQNNKLKKYYSAE